MMKKTEQVLAFLSIPVLVLNLLMDSGTVAAALVLLSLAIIYFYLSFALFNDVPFRGILKKESYRSISSRRILGTVALGIFLSMTIIGLMFKFLNLPGSQINLFPGLGGLLVASIITLTYFLKSKSDYYSRILRRTMFFGLLGLILLLIPEKTWVEIKFRNHPKYVEALKKSIDDPTNKALLDEVEKEEERMAREEK